MTANAKHGRARRRTDPQRCDLHQVVRILPGAVQWVKVVPQTPFYLEHVQWLGTPVSRLEVRRLELREYGTNRVTFRLGIEGFVANMPFASRLPLGLLDGSYVPELKLDVPRTNIGDALWLLVKNDGKEPAEGTAYFRGEDEA